MLVPPESPELLAPAGDWECAQAAVANGADAIYFGLQSGFNARARATNFTLPELPELMAFLAAHRVRGYCTLNTLVFTQELSECEAHVRALAAAGVDAVLVQDLGLARLIRRLAPKLPIHASTQMSLTSAECLDAVASLELDRVVLPRELSLEQVGAMRAVSTVPLEIFVHGALCVAYSGQCLTSESFGGRSANRGQCAQACRLPYDLICDGEEVDLGAQKYLLSPLDLAAYPLLPQLLAAGVCSLKIEGRLKTPEYVANITRHYRRAIDRAMAGLPLDFTAQDQEEMELSFSRGFSVGWLQGCDHKALVPALSSAKRGILAGTIHSKHGHYVVAELQTAVRPGDGLVFEGGRLQNQEQGGRVYQVEPWSEHGRTPPEHAHATSPGKQLVRLAFENGAIDLEQLTVGQAIWKTDDPQLSKRLRKSFTGRIPGRDLSVQIALQARVGEPLVLQARCLGEDWTFRGQASLAPAEKHPLTADVAQAQLGRLGGTGFVLSDFSAEIAGGPMVPFSVWGTLRKELVDKLSQAFPCAPQSWPVSPEPVLPAWRAEIKQRWSLPSPNSMTPSLHILCRSMQQLQQLLELGETHILLEFQDLRAYRPALELAAAKGVTPWLATPRIQKPGELGVFAALAKQNPPGILARNLAALAYFTQRKIPCIADFSLNAANELTVDYLLELGSERVTAAYDLNRDQVLDLVHAGPAERIEVVIHQHMPMFHMEHCVFCAVLSPGTNHTNCGRPCDTHVVKLRDRTGQEHPLTADVGCRNTLYNAQAQSGAEVVPALLKAGVRHFRLELLDYQLPAEAPHVDNLPQTASGAHGSQRARSASPPVQAMDSLPIRQIVKAYRDLLAGKRTGTDVWKTLQASNRLGVTRGTLDEKRNPLAIL